MPPSWRRSVKALRNLEFSFSASAIARGV